MESEQTQSFNERLNQWVSAQGFWFQLRHSMAAGGSKGSVVFHLFRLGVRRVVVGWALGGARWVVLVKWRDARAGRVGLASTLAIGLGATEARMDGFKQSRGELEISVHTSEGGPGSFFNALEAS